MSPIHSINVPWRVSEQQSGMRSVTSRRRNCQRNGVEENLSLTKPKHGEKVAGLRQEGGRGHAARLSSTPCHTHQSPTLKTVFIPLARFIHSYCKNG